MSDQYPAFPKVQRLHRSTVITEKIDGTNALVSVRRLNDDEGPHDGEIIVEEAGKRFGIRAGKRTAWLTGPHDDNFGFWQYVRDNALMLKRLGIGNHYGEWWGEGIGRRGYPIEGRRFSLFDQRVYVPPGVHQVPVIPRGDVASALELLRTEGSLACPGFMDPEGLIFRVTDLDVHYKVMLENDDIPKSVLEGRA